MPTWGGGIVRALAFAVLAWVMRSPILVGAVSFVGGMAFYHFFPTQAEHYLSAVLSILGNLKDSIGL